MRLEIDNKECWIKDGIELPLNFDSRDSSDKWNYICSNKLLHRENGPAKIHFEGSKYWYLNGLLHRKDGPAAIWSCGTEIWILNGKRHRLDGPAYTNFYGTEIWWLNNVMVDEKIYKRIQNSSKEELLVYMINPKYKDYLPLIEHRLSL